MKLYPRDIASLIEIRNFLAGSMENFNIKLSREEMKSIQSRIVYLDKSIIDASLKMDIKELDMSLAEPKTNSTVREIKINSTENIMDKVSES